MIYITYEDMCRDIRQNLTKIPRDVAGVIGVARSGMLPATMIAEHLNVGLASVDAVIESGSVECAISSHGGRRLRHPGGNKLLIVDDTCFHGNSLTVTKQKTWHDAFQGWQLVFLVVYLEGPCERDKPDIWLRDIREEAKGGPFGWAIYEWNLFAHGRLTERTLFDLDGVICVEPPDERLTEQYESYIANPTPLYVPTANMVNICTYRLEKYREKTVTGLREIGLECIRLYMNQAADYDSRKLGPSAWQQKAEIYRDANWLLFIESSDWQAFQICHATGKPVISIETNKLYLDENASRNNG